MQISPGCYCGCCYRHGFHFCRAPCRDAFGGCPPLLLLLLWLLLLLALLPVLVLLLVLPVRMRVVLAAALLQALALMLALLRPGAAPYRPATDRPALESCAAVPLHGARHE